MDNRITNCAFCKEYKNAYALAEYEKAKGRKGSS